MHTKAIIAALAAVYVSAPLSAQSGGVLRIPDVPIIFGDGSVIRGPDARGTIFGSSSGRSRVPPGHLPQRGMCRVWIDGVPPGRQPPVTDCLTAERNRVARSRVIYGNRESFPGRGRGKFDRTRTTDCIFRDANGNVIDRRDRDVWGRVIDVCRDANGNVIDGRDRDVWGRVIDRGDRDVWGRHDDDDDDVRFDGRERKGHKGFKAKHGKKGKHGN